MPPEAVQWEPAIGVLAGGLVLGLLVAWWLRRRGGVVVASPSEGPPLELRDLDGRFAALLVQLRELEDAAVKRTPEQLARERYALELEAARTLQAREAFAARLAPATAASATGAATAHTARGFLWGVLSSAAVAVLFFFVTQAASRRPEGGSVTGGGTGGVPRGSAEGAGAASPEAGAGPEAKDAEAAELRAALARNPDDFDKRLELARHLLGQHDLMGVWNETQYVLERQPKHPRALTYQALVRLAMGQGEMAVQMLKQAIAAEPDLLEAHENLAFVYTSLGRTKEAEAEVAETTRRSPEDGERLKHALTELAASRGKQGATPESVSAHQGVPPPAETAEDAGNEPASAAPAMGGSAAAAAAPAPGAAERPGGVFGWIEADAATAARIARMGPRAVIFVYVRQAGVTQGPPVAAKRIAPGSFPLQFEVSAADSMMGQPLPESMRIDVRADSDGDPMTKPASDPQGFADAVAIGKTGVRISLR